MMEVKKKVAAVVLGYVNIIGHTLVSFILTPIMIGIWGDASYGVYKIILSFMTFFMLVDSGIRNTVIRFVSEYRAKNERNNERRYIATVSSYYLIASVILCALVSAFSYFIPTLYEKSLTADEIEIVVHSLPWLTAFTVATLFFNCFTALLRGHNRHLSVQGVNILRTIARFVVLYIVLNMGTTVINAIMIDCIIAIVFAAFVLFYVFVIMNLPPLFAGINKSFINHIVSFTSVMLVMTISDSLLWSVGNFLVGIMTSSTMAAVYATAIMLTNIFQSLTSNVSQVITPTIMTRSFQIADIAELNKLMLAIGKIKSHVMFPIAIGFAVFGNSFIKMWIGENYHGSYVIALMIMSVLAVALIQDVPYNYALAHNRHGKLAVATSLGASLNFVITIILVNIWGIYGAALGTIISYFLSYVIYTYVLYTRDFGFKMSTLYVEVILKRVPFLAIMVAVGMAISVIPLETVLGDSRASEWVGLSIKILLFCTVYALLLYSMLLNNRQGETRIGKVRM